MVRITERLVGSVLSIILYRFFNTIARCLQRAKTGDLSAAAAQRHHLSAMPSKRAIWGSQSLTEAFAKAVSRTDLSSLKSGSAFCDVPYSSNDVMIFAIWL